MKKIYLRFIPLIAALFACFSCASNLPIQKTPVLTAYMANSNLKYYIRPTRLESENYKSDNAYIMLDFTYQMKEREYATDAYTNFSLYYKTTNYITSASFLLQDGTTVPLENITLLDRNTKQAYLRVSTILEKPKIKQVLNELCYNDASLQITLDDGTALRFFPTAEAKTKISDVFSK